MNGLKDVFSLIFMTIGGIMFIVKLICCFLLPPMAAYLQVGLTPHFWINLILTVVSLWTLGIVHALYLVLTDQKA